MGVSQAEKAKSRDRILTAAARQIREGGLESVSIGELMKAAQLTHGAFYAHFGSRADLLAAALDRALEQGAERSRAAAGARDKGMQPIVHSYLSTAHRDNVGDGCAVAALAGDAARADEPIRAIMRDKMAAYIDSTAERLGGGPQARGEAIAAWSTMVGALALSRLFAGEELSDEILRDAREAILGGEASDGAT